jgi:hypothetical protein
MAASNLGLPPERGDDPVKPRPKPGLPHEDFSLVLGGPLYQMYLRSRLLTPPADLVGRRIGVFIAVTWAPLVVLALASGTAWSGVAVPFLLDVDVHVRFLLALPMLIGAEVLVHRRLRATVEQFFERGIVAPDQRAAFEDIVDSTMRLRNSAVIEIALLIASITLGYVIWRGATALRVDTWYAMSAELAGAQQFTVAGWWYAFISLNVFRFMLMRWYFRLILWYIFLWRVARLPLRLNALHPDCAGGLGFLGNSAFALLPLLVAHTTTLSGVIGGRIWHEGVPLTAFRLELAGSVALLMAAALAPLAFFVFQLARAKREGGRAYGLLAMRYVDEFRDKWLRERRPGGEALVGSADLQSLADLSGGNDNLRNMGFFPVGRRAVVTLAIFIALPFAPLLLTLIPFEELVGRLVKMIV